MQQELFISQLFKELIIATSGALADSEIEKRFSATMGSIFGVDKVSIRNPSGEGGNAPNELYGYISNTKKSYVDNQLSEYSSFPELIGFKNRGYRSCAIVPIIVSGKVVSIVEMLSLSENKFSNDLINSASLAAYFTALALLYKSESERSIRLASYFNSAFNGSDPQMLVSQEGKIIKINDSARREFSAAMVSLNISEFLGMDFNRLASLSRSGNATASIGDAGKKTYKIGTSKINDKLIHISFHDITELERLSRSFSLMDASANVGILYLGSQENEFRVIGSTKSIKSIIGYDENLVIGKSLIELVAERQRGEMKEMISRLDGQERMHGTTDFASQNGIPSHIDFVMSKSANGYVMLFSSAKAEGFLQSVNSAFMDFISNTSDIVITMDNLGYIKDCNMPVENALGYSRAELVGKEVRSLYDDQSVFERNIAFVRNGGKIDNTYVTLLNRMGNKIDGTHSIRLFRGPDSTDYIIVIKELETKRKLNDLEDKLLKEEARVSRLKSTGELKSQFIYNISHELKTPLTNIKGFSKLLYSGEFGQLNRDQLNYIGTIIDEADRLMLIIQQVLDAAKLESEKMNLELREVNLKELYNNPTIQSMRESAEQKGLKFSWIVDFDVPNIIADPNRLIQVFVNLIGNSIKFTDKGNISVRISRKTKGSVKCEVADTGIGISEEDQRRLFKKFYEAPKKGLVKQEGAGTGLGLSIAREIVKLHGGKIACESELDRGSKFTFTLRVKPKKKKRE